MRPTPSGSRRWRGVLFVAIVLTPVLACVDLFHTTDFDTLCTRDPKHPTCVARGSDDGGGGTSDTGADASKPLLDFCTLDPTAAKERAKRTCALLGACGGPLGDTSLGACMLQALYAFDCNLNPGLRPAGNALTLWSCLAQAKQCDDIDACLYPATPPQCAAVASGTFTTCAEGAPIRVVCGSELQGAPTGVEPCALTGRTCAKIDQSTASCVGTAGVACPLGLACRGTSAVDCRTSESTTLDRGLDCAAFGAQSCVEDDAGIACAPKDGISCTGSSAVTCDDAGVAISCVAGRRVTIDCNALGVACDVTTNGASPLTPLAACGEYVDAGACSGPDTCDGDVVRGCAQGIPFSIACGDYALGTCKPSERGPHASCTRD